MKGFIIIFVSLILIGILILRIYLTSVSNSNNAWPLLITAALGMMIAWGLFITEKWDDL